MMNVSEKKEFIGRVVSGEIDRLSEDDMDGEISVIDFKTSKKPKNEDWISDYFIQAAFYFNAFYEHTKILPKNTKIIICCQDGQIQEFTKSARDNKYWTERLKTRISLYKSKQQESEYG